MEKYFSGKRIAQIAILSAMGTILYLLRFPISQLFPFFLELHFSDIPALIGGFAYGPISGLIIIIIKVLLKLLINGSSSMFVGEIADVLVGSAFVITSSLIYKYHRTLKGALLALVLGTVASVVMSMLANWLIVIPCYIAFGMATYEQLVGFCSIIPGINGNNFFFYYIFFAVLPFNMIRCVGASIMTFILYKRLSGLINKL